VEEVHKFIIDGINAALDMVAPVKEIAVKTGSSLYLSREALEMMKRRDSARAGTPRFQALRKAANRLVKRDKLASNTETLSKASSDPRVLWQLANDALGKAPDLSPASARQRGGEHDVGQTQGGRDLSLSYIFILLRTIHKYVYRRSRIRGILCTLLIRSFFFEYSLLRHRN
jgi:hypothetical protein